MINFPANPSNGQVYTLGVKAWVWNGRAWDLQSISDAQVLRAETAATNSQSYLQQIQNFLSGAAASAISYIQLGTGAVAEAVQDALRKNVMPTQFGAKLDGVADDTAAIQRGLTYCASGGIPRKLKFPGGSVCLITDSLLIPKTATGMVMEGDSWKGVYLKTPAGSTFPLIKVAGSYFRISGFFFRPGGDAQPCMNIYAANCTVTGNQFLAAVNNHGSAILLSDTDPDTGTPVAGAYSHNITNNIIGLANYAWAHCVEDMSALGLQALKIKDNCLVSDSPVKISKGGANVYRDNLIQSSTMGGTGSGIDLGAAVNSEKISGNYFEGFAQGVLLRQTTSTYQACFAVDNHFDACTNEIYSLGTINYVYESEGGARLSRGWKDDFSSNAMRVFNGPSGGIPILTFDDTNKAIKLNRMYFDLNTLNFNADGMTLTPTSQLMQVHGTGAARANCVLGKAGISNNYPLKLIGMTWPVTIVNTNVRFANGAASVTFGNAPGNIQSMDLIYLTSQNQWVETGRTVY